MRGTSRLVLALSALALTPAGSLVAQDEGAPPGLRVVSAPPTRAGFWGLLGFGVGGQSFRVNNDGLGFRPVLYKPTFNLRMGGTVNENLRLGGELFTWWNPEFNTVEVITGLMFVGQIYPSRTAGLYVKGGAGIGWSGLYDDFGTISSDVGFSTTAGVGYEVRLGQKVFLVPTVDLVYQFYSSRAFAGYNERVVNFGLAVMFQSR